MTIREGRFEHKGWIVLLEMTAVGPDDALAGHADIHCDNTLRCRIASSVSTHRDRQTLLEKLGAKATAYIDECLMRLSASVVAPVGAARLGAPPPLDGLLRLIYVSRAPTLVDTDVQDILATARRNNPTHEITGALCFLDGVYMQYLEGPGFAVDALYRSIARDARHFMPKVLERRGITKRYFTDWTMALLVWDHEKELIVRTHSQAAELDLYEVAPDAAVPLLRALTQAQGWTAL